MTNNERLLHFVAEVEALCQPDRVHWCDGTKEESEKLLEEAVAKGNAVKLNQSKKPNCYLFRSDPSDVARVEDRTYIASVSEDDASPTTGSIRSN